MKSAVPFLVFFVFIFLGLSNTVYSQTALKKYVRENAIGLKNNNALLIDDGDLAFIDSIATNHSVILLGESTHCDSIIPIVKLKIVEYLHKKHGYDVLCFESDFFSITKACQKIKQKSMLDEAFIDSNITFMFTQSGVYKHIFKSLLPYVKNNERGLILSGFDNQIAGYNFKKDYPSYISEYLKKIELNHHILFDSSDLMFLNVIDTTYFYDPLKVDTNELRFIAISISKIIDKLNSVDSLKNTFGYLALENLQSLCLMNLSAIQSDSDMYGFNIRDRQMAKNLNWIINSLYPDKKIIVWAHNIHIMYNSSGPYPGYISMGEVLKTTGATNRIYNIGFTSRNTYTCMWPQDTIKYNFSTSKKHLFELYFPKNEFCFLNFKKCNNLNLYHQQFRSKLTLDGFMHNWFQGFDGVFYIKTLHPSSF